MTGGLQLYMFHNPLLCKSSPAGRLSAEECVFHSDLIVSQSARVLRAERGGRVEPIVPVASLKMSVREHVYV